MISVIIPTYRRECEVVRAVRSVLVQTYQDFEIIVGDDYGKDRTQELLEVFGDSRIRYFYNDGMGGSPSANRNLCLERARGAYLTFLDSDDFMLPQRLELQLEAIQRGGPKVEFSISGTRVIKVKGGVQYFDRDLIPSAEGDLSDAFFGRRLRCYNTSVMLSRKAWLEVGSWDPQMEGCDDPEFLTRLVLNYHGATVSELCTVWFDHDGDSHSSVLDHRRKGITAYLNKYPELWSTYPVWFRSRVEELLHVLFVAGEAKHFRCWFKRLTRRPSAGLRLMKWISYVPGYAGTLKALYPVLSKYNKPTWLKAKAVSLDTLIPEDHLDAIKPIL